MPILEKHEVQENRLWYRVEVTEEQAREFEEAYDSESEWPEWVWDLDWDHRSQLEFHPSGYNCR